MNYLDYEWSRNPRGLHHRNLTVDVARYTDPRMGWAKFVAGGGEFVRVCADFVNRGITPIYRIFRHHMGAMRMTEEHYATFREYINAGVRWFELYNEPNLEGEWPQKNQPGGGPTVYISYENTEECIKPLMDNWLEWAENIIAMGGYPAFPALTDSSDGRHSTVFWYRQLLRYLADKHYQRTYDVFTNGGWAATHPYLFNHFYQATAGGPPEQPRPYTQQNANEGGWHFEYPYDPLQKTHDPGRTVFGGTALAPNGDTNGLIAAGDCFNRLIYEYWGIGPLPVIATEGGATVPDPRRDDEFFQQDKRYPGYSTLNFSEITMAMWKWIVNEGPDWFWGVTLWDEPAYYDAFGRVPAVDRMAAEPVEYMDVPSFDVRNGQPVTTPRFEVPAAFRFAPVTVSGETPDDPPPSQPTATPDDQPTPTPQPTATPIPGPGPLVGPAPDHHWLLLAPGLQADWFFQAARKYWQVFRPTVITEWGWIDRIPNSNSLAITVLARTDTITYMNSQLRDQWPTVLWDPIVFNTLEQMAAELNRRATTLERFG
jgi:hypothetical protein